MNQCFKKFKEEERNKVEIWASALVELQTLPADADPGNLPLKIFQNNTSTPMILVNRDGAIKVSNMRKEVVFDTSLIQKKINT